MNLDMTSLIIGVVLLSCLPRLLSFLIRCRFAIPIFTRPGKIEDICSSALSSITSFYRSRFLRRRETRSDMGVFGFCPSLGRLL